MMNPQFGMMNFGMPMGNMYNANMANNLDDENEEWMKGFKMGVEEVNSSQSEDNNPGPKMNIIFRTTQGTNNNKYDLSIWNYIRSSNRKIFIESRKT